MIRTIQDILSSYKNEILDDIHQGNSFLKYFMVCVENDIRERDAEEFGKGLDSKIDLEMYYRKFGEKRKFKRYYHRCSDEGARLLFIRHTIIH